MALLTVPEGVICEIYDYLDCTSLWNLSRTHSKFSKLRTSTDKNILDFWRNACKKYSPTIGQYRILKSWFEVGFEDPVDYRRFACSYYDIDRRAFLCQKKKEFHELYNELVKNVISIEHSSELGETPYGNGCRTVVWISTATAYRVECKSQNSSSKTYVVYFRFIITKRNFIASGSGGVPRFSYYAGKLTTEQHRKWLHIQSKGKLYYSNYSERELNEKEYEDSSEDLEDVIQKEFRRRTEWYPIDKKDCTIVLLGSIECGKTSYVTRLVKDQFPTLKWPYEQSYEKICQISNGEFRVELFDSSQATFFITDSEHLCWTAPSSHANVRAHYHYTRSCSPAFILLVDTNSEDSLQAAKHFLTEFQYLSHVQKELCCMVLATKIDSPDRKISEEEISSFAQQHGMMYGKVSALTGENVQESFLNYLENKVIPWNQRMREEGEKAANARQAKKKEHQKCSVM